MSRNGTTCLHYINLAGCLRRKIGTCHKTPRSCSSSFPSPLIRSLTPNPHFPSAYVKIDERRKIVATNTIDRNGPVHATLYPDPRKKPSGRFHSCMSLPLLDTLLSRRSMNTDPRKELWTNGNSPTIQLIAQILKSLGAEPIQACTDLYEATPSSTTFSRAQALRFRILQPMVF